MKNYDKKYQAKSLEEALKIIDRLNIYIEIAVAKQDLAYCNGFVAGHNNCILSISEKKENRLQAESTEISIENRRGEALKYFKEQKSKLKKQ